MNGETETFSLQRGPLSAPALVAVCAAAGLAVSLGFASLMYLLVHSSEMRLAEKVSTQLLDFVRVKRDEVAQRKDRKPERPQLNEVPEAPPTAAQSASSADQLAVSFSVPDVSGDALNIDSDMGIGNASGEFLPIVKVAPVYPRRALQHGITGSCMVRYTVTTAGTVKDVQVVEEQCPEIMFQRPSIEAAERFRYKPRVVNGTSIEVRGVRNVFYFEREDTATEGASR